MALCQRMRAWGSVIRMNWKPPVIAEAYINGQNLPLMGVQDKKPGDESYQLDPLTMIRLRYISLNSI